MGKLRDKLKKIGKAAIVAGAAYGASKMMAGKGMSPNAKLALNKNAKNLKTRVGAAQDLANSTKRPSNLTKDMGMNRKLGDIKTVPFKGNKKSIYANDDGTLQRGDKLYKNKNVYKNRNKNIATKKKETNIFGGMTAEQRAAKAAERKARILEFQKNKNKKATGGMTKAKSGKMIKANSGRMNLLEQVGRLDAMKKPDRNIRAEKRRVVSELNSGAKKGKMMKYSSGGMTDVTTRGQGVILAGKKTKTYIC